MPEFIYSLIIGKLLAEFWGQLLVEIQFLKESYNYFF